MSIENKKSNKVSEEKQIKNAIIDLLHNGEEATLDAISEATGLTQSSLEKHSESINSMLGKLKKMRTPGSM